MPPVTGKISLMPLSQDIQNFLTTILKNKITFCLAAIAIFAHYITLFAYTQNIPIGDDYYDVFRFLNQYDNAPTITERLFSIFTQHNEHRTAFNRLIYLVMYKLTGGINFKALMIIGDFSTIGLITLLCLQYKNKDSALAIAAFIIIFLLGIQNWTSMFWAMTAISNYSVSFFTLACFATLATEKKLNIYAAIFFATCASLSMGNGITIWPLGVLCIALTNHKNRTHWLVLWLLASIAFIFLYFHNYTSSIAIKAPFELGFTIDRLQNLFHWFLVFLGSCWTFESSNTAVAATAGAILFLIAIPCFFLLLNRMPTNACFIAYILISAAITSYSRFSLFGPEVALTSRYKIYSIYLSCVIFATLFMWLSEKKIYPRLFGLCFLTAASLHTLATYWTSFAPLQIERRDVADSMRRWLLTQKASRFEFALIPDGGIWIENAIVSKRWDPRILFTDSLNFHRIRDSDVCTKSNYAGNINLSISRNEKSMAGEITIDDQPAILDKIKYVITCKGTRAYSANAINRSRDIDGKMVFHFFKIDPLEQASAFLFVTNSGASFRGIKTTSNRLDHQLPSDSIRDQ
jgi:hypothetical protein